MALRWLSDEARSAGREELAWASECLGLILLYAVSLARFVDRSGVDTSQVVDPTKPYADSANHVVRTLVRGGRALDRLLKFAGPGSADYLSAFAAPLVLAMLHSLPRRAREYLDASVSAARVALPGLLAMLALIDAVEPLLTTLPGTTVSEKLQRATEEDRAAVHAATRSWASSHPDQALYLESPAA
jgi:hypothetical protein